MNKRAKILTPKAGQYIQFGGMSMIIYGYICRVNGTSVDYVRDNMTRWTASTNMVEKGVLITEEDFIDRVKLNAHMNAHVVPSTKSIQEGLAMFLLDYKVDMNQVIDVLET